MTLNGKTCVTAIPEGHTPTLCDTLKIPNPGDEPNDAIATRYCNAIHAFIHDEISESEMWSIIASRACLPNGWKGKPTP